MTTLSTTLQGVTNGQATLADLDRPISQLADDARFGPSR